MSLTDMVAPEMLFEDALTISDATSDECCLILPGTTKRLHWGLPDSSAPQGRLMRSWHGRGPFETRSNTRSRNGAGLHAPWPVPPNDERTVAGSRPYQCGESRYQSFLDRDHFHQCFTK